MNSFDPSAPLWDFSQTTDYSNLGQLGDEQFLELLQKQFAHDFNPAVAFNPDGVDPTKLTSLTQPIPPPPLSTDSSPSPSSANEQSSISRRQSRSFESTEEPHKRKATDDDVDDLDDGPNHKSAKKSSATKRKNSTSQDEGRLQKRKEQNRAAQRAFRERKEKHVKDLEDQVAQLEAKNEASQTENSQLRELLKRLQEENMVLKQAQFTFSVPKPSSEPSQPFNNVATTSFGSSPGSAFAPSNTNTSNSSPHSAGITSPQSTSLDTPSSAFPADIDFGQLTSFDQSQINMLDEGGDAQMSYNFGYGQVVPSVTPYKTIASNTMFMSFAEPSPSSDASGTSQRQSPSLNGGVYDLSTWSPNPSALRRNDTSTRQGTFDELFGGNMFGAQAPMSPASFTNLMNASGSATISPVIHAQRSPSNSGISGASSPSGGSGSSNQSQQHSQGESGCPKTKSEFEQMVNKSGSSMFAPPPPPAESIPSGPGAVPALHKAIGVDGHSPMITCKGASFPPTEKRDDNVEVLTAWRNITSHPHFKASNIDINELCQEFTDKARCDGTKIVLDQQGVQHIINRLSQRYQQSIQGSSPASNATPASHALA